jgi:hypothetical protein
MTKEQIDSHLGSVGLPHTCQQDGHPFGLTFYP